MADGEYMRLGCADCGVKVSARAPRCRPCSGKALSQRLLADSKWRRECEWCKAQYRARVSSTNLANGYAPRYCSIACCSMGRRQATLMRDVARRTLGAEATAKPQTMARCPECGGEFAAKIKTQRFCGPACTYSAMLRRKRSEYTPKPPTKRKCLCCGDLFDGVGRQVHCSAACGRRMRKSSGNNASRAKAAGTIAKHFNEVRILQRDRWRCQLCGVSTPKRLRGTKADNAPEIDHIVPLSEGGNHVQENVQCACRRCNSEKGAKARGQLLLTGFADFSKHYINQRLGGGG